MLGVLALVALVVTGGCSNAETIPKHGVDDQKAIDAYKTMTPQQKIDLIEKGPLPRSAKDATIKKIKDENHMN